MSRFIVATLALSACITNIGNGVAEQEIRNADGAVAFNNASPVESVVCIGDEPGVRLTCDSNLLDEIVTRVVDGELRLELQPNTSISPRTDCVAEVVVTELDAVTQNGSGAISVTCDVEELTMVNSHASGAVSIAGAGSLQEVGGHGSGAIDIASVRGCNLAVDHSASGRVSLGDVQLCEISVSSSGSGATELDGAVDDAFVGVSGSGSVEARDLVATDAALELSGSGSVHITVTDSVDVSVRASGSAHIYGDPPDRNVDDSGSGSIVFE